MAIRLITGKLGSGMTLTVCTPPAINSEASGASAANEGQGVCIPYFDQSGRFSVDSSLGCQVAILSRASRRPDSIMPFLMAFLITRYQTHIATANPTISEAARSHIARAIWLFTCCAICTEFMVPFVKTRIFARQKGLHASVVLAVHK